MQGQLKSFRDLKVWQKALDLAAGVYAITEKFPKSELYGITNQMRRSAVSISSNIAEGFKRGHQKEKLQFYNIAYASTAELESQIEVSCRLNFLHDDDYKKLGASIVEIGKMLDGLIKSQSKHSKSYILNSIFFLILLFSTFYILNPSPVFAAEISLEPKTSFGATGELFQLGVFLDTKGETANAVSGKVMYPTRFLSPYRITYEESAVSLWVERPQAVEPSVITFSGIIPGGLWGEKIPLFFVVFEGVAEGKAPITVVDGVVLRNDGAGSALPTEVRGGLISLVRGGKESASSRLLRATLSYDEDREPPEIFAPVVGKSSSILDGKYFVVFETQDKKSGIDHYEAQETRLALPAEGKWVRAESPLALADQNRKSFIFVKALDKAGNERVAFVSPAPVDSRAYLTLILSGIIILLLAFFCARPHIRI
ncbi:MAG: four helix bundle protein [Candidatus Taylorbacteria bacterium]|nr:four helix bundle protein [Candidatus Taylorbacteria bacterium]